MNEIKSNGINSFPNEFVPSSVKATKDYFLKYAKAFHEEAAHGPMDVSLCRNNKNLKRYKQYARGEQSQLQYKELMGLKREKGDVPNHSFRNINYEILKVVPRIRNSAVNKIISIPLRMRARAIDPKSISAKQKYRSKLLEFIVNKEEIERFEQLARLGLERPIPPGEVPPASAAEIDPYIEMNPKDITSMEVLDMLEKAFEDSNWKQEKKEIVGDLFDYGVGGTRQYIDVNGKIKSRRVMIDRSVTNHCVLPDFRDMIRFGEYLEKTISQLRREAKNLKEEELKDIAHKTSVARGGNGYIGKYSEHYNSGTYSYAYDHEKVTVFELLYLTTDSEVNVEYKNSSGNTRTKTEAPNYVPFLGDASVNDGKGLTDDEFNKKFEGKKRIYRTEVRNVYQGTWVVDTEYCYSYGLMTNMLRPATDWQETVLPVVLVSTDFISTIGMIEQAADQVQLNYLQYQSHSSQSKPPGIAIEKKALARTGKGNAKLDPKKALEMYAETGSFIYDGYDQHDSPLNTKPFEELVNGLSQGASDHLVLMKQWIDQARDMVGLNVLSEGGTPAERTGKEVAQLAFNASDNAMSHILEAYKTIYEKSGKNMFYLLQNNVQRMNPAIISESLGMESYKYFMLNRDLPLIDMGIILEEGPDDKVKEKISAILNLMVTNKEIPGEKAIEIEMVENPYRQILMIRKHVIERENREAAKQENLMRVQGEENTKTAVATEQAKQKSMQMEFQQKMAEKEFDKQQKKQEDDRKFLHEMILKGAELKEGEAERVNELLMALLKGQMDIAKEKSKPKPQPATSKP